MNKKIYKLNVYDSATGKVENIEVTESVYNAYRRSGWNIKDNNHSFFAHEIQMSGLIGGKDGSYENFHEFISDSDGLEQKIIFQLNKESLHKALELLSDNEQRLIADIYFYGKTERECATELGINRNAVHKKKQRILTKLKNILEK